MAKSQAQQALEELRQKHEAHITRLEQVLPQLFNLPDCKVEDFTIEGPSAQSGTLTCEGTRYRWRVTGASKELELA